MLSDVENGGSYMTPQLQRIKLLSDRLNALADWTMQQLIQTEGFLADECHLGISEDYILVDGSFNYGRIDNKGPFVLYYLDVEGKATRIQNLKREKRFQFLIRLPQLLSLIENRMEEQIEKMEHLRIECI